MDATVGGWQAVPDSVKILGLGCLRTYQGLENGSPQAPRKTTRHVVFKTSSFYGTATSKQQWVQIRS